MSPLPHGPRKTRCSAKSARRKRKWCAHKELRFYGVEDGYNTPIFAASCLTGTRGPGSNRPHCETRQPRTQAAGQVE